MQRCSMISNGVHWSVQLEKCWRQVLQHYNLVVPSEEMARELWNYVASVLLKKVTKNKKKTDVYPG